LLKVRRVKPWSTWKTLVFELSIWAKIITMQGSNRFACRR
jgi:hypothetical protein